METVVITAPSLTASGMELLKARNLRVVTMPLNTSPEQLRDIVKTENPHGIISRAIQIDATTIEAAPRLKVISKYGVGYDNIDVVSAKKKDIPVLITRGANSQSVAELAIGLTLAVGRRLLQFDRKTRRGDWDRTINPGIELNSKVFGIVGYGSIGKKVANLANAFGAEVHIFDPYVSNQNVSEAITSHAELSSLLATADMVSLHCPLKADTHHLLSEAMLARMKRSAILINTARGGIVDEAALLRILEKGHLTGIGIDTYAMEPPGADNPLFTVPNAVFTPHCGASTAESAERVSRAVVQNLILGLDGKALGSPDLVTADAKGI